MSKRGYMIMIKNVDTGEVRKSLGYKLEEAVWQVQGWRQDGDGSEVFQIVNMDTGYVVTRGDVRRAGLAGVTG